MKYLEVALTLSPYKEMWADVLTAILAEIGFDSFQTEEDGLKAYIPVVDFSEDALAETIAQFPSEDMDIRYQVHEVEEKDWNEEWERHYFQPIVIDERCVIHSTFHTDYPRAMYDIVINPQMAFGTGHHETTSSILTQILETDMEGKRVLDMGCGTSILAILARMKGAKEVVAIDIDEWCVNNSRDNIALNHLTNIDVRLGDANTLTELLPFDIIIANINRNILLNDMERYVHAMNKGAKLLMSGFYTEDISLIRDCAERLGLTWQGTREKNNWAVVCFEK